MTTVKTQILHWATKTKHFAKNNLALISLVFSISALALSGYSFYLIKYKTPALPGTVVTPKITNKDIASIINSGVPVMGNINAKVTVIEFADFQCPYCGKFYNTILPEIKSKYIDTGKIRFVYMSFAFLGEESVSAAEAVQCAGEQNNFWQYHNYLYENQQGENQGAFSVENLKKFAVKLNLNKEQFNSCLDSHKYKSRIEEETALGKKFGVRGTPSTFVNDFFISGAQTISYFSNRIEAKLNE